jgi:hypothetical protein
MYELLSLSKVYRLIQKQPLCLLTGGDVLARPFVVEYKYICTTTTTTNTQLNRFQIVWENWWCHGSLFCCFLATLCSNSPDCSSWIMVSEVSVCVCVCVCLSLSLSLSLPLSLAKFHKRSTPHTQLWISQQLLTSISNLLAKLRVCTSPMLCGYFKILKESHPLVGFFFEFFQNQRITGGFGFFKKIQKMLNWPVLYHFSLKFLRTVGKKHQNWVLWIVLRTLFMES